MPPSSQRLANSRTRIPPHVERMLNQQMKKAVSPSMQKYVGAYVQQNAGNFGPQGVSQPVQTSHPGAVVNHTPSSIHFEQTHDPAQEITKPDEAKVDINPYDFIEENVNQPSGPSRNGRIIRIALLGLALIVLLIGFNFVKKLASGPSNYEDMKQVVFTQQQIISIADDASREQTLSQDNRNAVTTTLFSVRSSQSETIQYMIGRGQKIKPKEFALAKDIKSKTKLTESLSSSTYNTTLVPIMRQKLAKYQSDISKAYKKTKGPKGKALLKESYNQAYLLDQQFSRSP